MRKSSGSAPATTGRHGAAKPKANSSARHAGSKPHATAKTSQAIDDETRRQMIAEAAYFRALSRAFTGDGEVDDWLKAERELDRALWH